MSDPIPAIIEAAATGETAGIFADIRNVLGVDVVNLIWRHLATIDGALPWAWGALRPLYADGSVGNEAKALRAALILPLASPIPAEVFAGLGLRPHDLTDIRGVLSSYDHTNAMAVVALSALQARLDGHLPQGVEPAQPSSVTASSLIALPRLLTLRRDVDRHRRTGDGLEPVRHAPSGGGAGQHVSPPCALAVLSVACVASARTDGRAMGGWRLPSRPRSAPHASQQIGC